MLIFFSLLFFPLLPAFSSFIPKCWPQIWLEWCKNLLPLHVLHLWGDPKSLSWCSHNNLMLFYNPSAFCLPSQWTSPLRGEKPSAFQLQNTSTVGFLPSQGCSGQRQGMQWVNTLGSLLCLAPKILEVLSLWINCTHGVLFPSAQVQAKDLPRLPLFRGDMILGSSIAVTSGGTNGAQECWVDSVTAAETIQPQQKVLAQKLHLIKAQSSSLCRNRWVRSLIGGGFFVSPLHGFAINKSFFQVLLNHQVFQVTEVEF